jgi:hypothetical protein
MSSCGNIVKKKCNKCSKKSLFINECKCQKFFCLNCSPYYVHNCIYNWRQDKKENLTELNPQIAFLKVENI